MFILDKQKDKAVLTIYGYVGGYYMDMRTVNQAIADVTKSGYTQLDFHFHTYGGDVIDGNLIYNFLAGFNGNVDIYIDGVAASMGSIIMLAGKNKPMISENGFIMIHCPSGGAYGNAEGLKQTAKLLTSMENNFKQKLIECTGKSEAEINLLFDGNDHWFDADEAIAYGLCSGKFSAKTQDIKTLDTTEASQLGAKAVFDRFTALTTNINQNPKKEMDKLSLIARFSLTGVTAESTDEQVLAALESKQKAIQETATAATKKSIEASVDASIAANKIKAEKRENYIARGEKIGIEELNAVFADMNPYASISENIKGDNVSDKDNKGDKPKAYSEYTNAELQAMVKADPAKFKAVYKAEFGVEPEL